MKNTLKMAATISLVAIIVFSTMSCNNGSTTTGSGPGSTPTRSGVYVAVSHGRNVGYWKDGVLHDVSNLANRNASKTVISRGVSEIYEFAGSVYVLAWEYYDDDTYMAYYYKDGERKDLSIPEGASSHVNFNAIVGNEGSIYIAGTYSITEGVHIACYWKDGVRKDFSAEDAFLGITASDGSIYIAGLSGNMAGYWKDDVRTDLFVQNPEAAFMTGGIAVSEGSVYITGFFNNGETTIACYWKDGVRINLPMSNGFSHSEATGIIISQGSVYVLGSSSDEKANYFSYYWKDGEEKALAVPTGITYVPSFGFTVSEGSVYVSGCYGKATFDEDQNMLTIHSPQTPCYWENGVIIDLPISASDFAVGGIMVIR
jgi:hypothetical protein